MKADVKGCSTCKSGEERYEKFYNKILKKYFYQYEYRSKEGALFSCVAATLEQCRDKKNRWLVSH